MEYVIFIARSVTQAQRMMRTLEAYGIWAKIFRAPVGLTRRGRRPFLVGVSVGRSCKRVAPRPWLRAR